MALFDVFTRTVRQEEVASVKCERDLVKLCLDYLTLHRVFHWRSNTGAMRNGQRFIRFGIPGIPDILIVHKGRVIGIECKGDKGEQSQAQKTFQSGFEAAGGMYVLVRRLEEMTDALR